jgi:hypothetical protein
VNHSWEADKRVTTKLIFPVHQRAQISSAETTRIHSGEFVGG